VFCVYNVKPEGKLTTEHEKTYEEANTLFVDEVIFALANHLQDVYLYNKPVKSSGMP
jgi:hypothetical protein